MAPPRADDELSASRHTVKGTKKTTPKRSRSTQRTSRSPQRERSPQRGRGGGQQLRRCYSRSLSPERTRGRSTQLDQLDRSCSDRNLSPRRGRGDLDGGGARDFSMDRSLSERSLSTRRRDRSLPRDSRGRDPLSLGGSCHSPQKRNNNNVNNPLDIYGSCHSPRRNNNNNNNNHTEDPLDLGHSRHSPKRNKHSKESEADRGPSPDSSSHSNEEENSLEGGILPPPRQSTAFSSSSDIVIPMVSPNPSPRLEEEGNKSSLQSMVLTSVSDATAGLAKGAATAVGGATTVTAGLAKTAVGGATTVTAGLAKGAAMAVGGATSVTAGLAMGAVTAVGGASLAEGAATAVGDATTATTGLAKGAITAVGGATVGLAKGAVTGATSVTVGLAKGAATAVGGATSVTAGLAMGAVTAVGDAANATAGLAMGAVTAVGGGGTNPSTTVVGDDVSPAMVKTTSTVGEVFRPAMEKTTSSLEVFNSAVAKTGEGILHAGEGILHAGAMTGEMVVQAGTMASTTVLSTGAIVTHGVVDASSQVGHAVADAGAQVGHAVHALLDTKDANEVEEVIDEEAIRKLEQEERLQKIIRKRHEDDDNNKTTSNSSRKSRNSKDRTSSHSPKRSNRGERTSSHSPRRSRPSKDKKSLDGGSSHSPKKRSHSPKDKDCEKSRSSSKANADDKTTSRSRTGRGSSGSSSRGGSNSPVRPPSRGSSGRQGARSKIPPRTGSNGTAAAALSSARSTMRSQGPTCNRKRVCTSTTSLASALAGMSNKKAAAAADDDKSVASQAEVGTPPKQEGADNEAPQGITLLDKIGGPDALKGLVLNFYERINKDAELKPFFKGVNLRRLKDHQYHFMKLIFSGMAPAEWNPSTIISDTHQRIFDKGANEQHFDLVVRHWEDAMRASGKMEHSAVQEVMDSILPLREIFQERAKVLSGRKTNMVACLGGEATLKQVLYEMYSSMISDPLLAPMLKGVSMTSLQNHQYKFVEIAIIGVPVDYDVVSFLQERHNWLIRKGVNGRHFDAMLQCLAVALKEAGIAEQQIEEARIRIRPLRAAFQGEEAAEEETPQSAQEEAKESPVSQVGQESIEDVSETEEPLNKAEPETAKNAAVLGADGTNLEEMEAASPKAETEVTTKEESPPDAMASRGRTRTPQRVHRSPSCERGRPQGNRAKRSLSPRGRSLSCQRSRLGRIQSDRSVVRGRSLSCQRSQPRRMHSERCLSPQRSQAHSSQRCGSKPSSVSPQRQGAESKDTQNMDPLDCAPSCQSTDRSNNKEKDPSKSYQSSNTPSLAITADQRKVILAMHGAEIAELLTEEQLNDLWSKMEGDPALQRKAVATVHGDTIAAILTNDQVVALFEKIAEVDPTTAKAASEVPDEVDDSDCSSVEEGTATLGLIDLADDLDEASDFEEEEDNEVSEGAGMELMGSATASRGASEGSKANPRIYGSLAIQLDLMAKKVPQTSMSSSCPEIVNNLRNLVEAAQVEGEEEDEANIEAPVQYKKKLSNPYYASLASGVTTLQLAGWDIKPDPKPASDINDEMEEEEEGKDEASTTKDSDVLVSKNAYYESLIAGLAGKMMMKSHPTSAANGDEDSKEEADPDCPSSRLTAGIAGWAATA